MLFSIIMPVLNEQAILEHHLNILVRQTSCLCKLGKVMLLPQYVTTSARRHEKIGLLRSVLFMWYLRTRIQVRNFACKAP